jgi:hypothetical protein
MDFLRNSRRRTLVLGALVGLGALVTVACWLGRSPTAPAPTVHCTPGRVDPERLKTHVRTPWAATQVVQGVQCAVETLAGP